MALDDDRTKLHEKNQLELLCFRLTEDGTIFAVNVFKVRETVKFQELTLLPDANDAVQGLLTLRDEILPVIDLKKWMLEGSASPKLINSLQDEEVADDLKQIIICEFNDTVIGVKVLRAEYILRKKWEDIHVPVSSEFGAKINNYTKNDDSDIVYIVDIETMLSEIFPFLVEAKDNETENLQSFDVRKDKAVLVAEDSKTALKALQAVLNKLGVQHRAFPNGRELLDYINSIDINEVGMVITDLEMPIASGFTVIKELKENNETRNIPIVVNSSMTGDSNQEMASKLNAEGFIGKTKPNEIASYIKQFMGV
ncbi:MAG: chemotaxis protein [Campylobacterales bacterium]|nr:chemotaxis protein [Campylobacterales bacterium]